MDKFKPGDRVKIIGREWDHFSRNLKIGDTGTILSRYDDTKWNIKFDKNFGGHTCGGECEDGYGQYLDEIDLELIIERIPPGTKVRILGGVLSRVGQIHVMEKDDGGDEHKDIPYLVRYDDGDYNWYNRQDLEIITETSTSPTKTYQSQSKITTEEISILDELNIYTYIARDYDNRLFVYIERPILDIGGKQYYSKSPYREVLKRDLFKFIKQGQSLEIKTITKDSYYGI